LIDFESVSARRGGRLVLHDVTCHIPTGALTLLLGASGSGKSTFLRLINRLTELASGSIAVTGRAIADWDVYDLRRGLGFVPQNLGLFPHRTVAQQLRLAAAAPIDVAPHLHAVELPTHYASRYPRELSGGEQQRVALARAMAADPACLLLDEAFSALDPPLRRELIRLVASLGRTIVLASHDPAAALPFAAQVLFLEQGRLIFAGSRAEYLASAQPSVVRYREAAAC
jgi:osmoprotectant transport system ATP-binding protein